MPPMSLASSMAQYSSEEPGRSARITLDFRLHLAHLRGNDGVVAVIPHRARRAVWSPGHPQPLSHRQRESSSLSGEVGSASPERPSARRARVPFTDLLTIKHVANELEKGTPLKVILRGLLAERQGQLELDFHAAPDTPRAKVVVLQGAAPGPSASRALRRCRADASVVRDGVYQSFPFSDPQTALAAKYFIEGSRLDDGEERNMEGAAAAYRKALVIDPDLVPAIVNLANIHYARDEMIEAQALYERAIGLDPDCFEAYFNLGNIHHDLEPGRGRPSLLSRRRRLNAGVPRRALLSGRHAREDRAFTGGQGALEGVSGSRAEWRVGGSGEGIQRVGIDSGSGFGARGSKSRTPYRPNPGPDRLNTCSRSCPASLACA